MCWDEISLLKNKDRQIEIKSKAHLYVTFRSILKLKKRFPLLEMADR